MHAGSDAAHITFTLPKINPHHQHLMEAGDDILTTGGRMAPVVSLGPFLGSLVTQPAQQLPFKFSHTWHHWCHPTSFASLYHLHMINIISMTDLMPVVSSLIRRDVASECGVG